MSTQVSQLDLIKFSLTELWRIKKPALVLFVVISLSVLTMGWFWPRVYISQSSILVDEYNILTPLMEGTAVATGVKDHAKNAWQLLRSQYAKERIVEFISGDIEGESEIDVDRIWEEIKYKTKVRNCLLYTSLSTRYRTSTRTPTFV